MSEDSSLGPDLPNASPDAEEPGPQNFLDVIEGWSKSTAALAALAAAFVAIVTNVKLFFEQQWAWAAALLILCVGAIALYLLLRRRPSNSLVARLLRIGAVVTLLIVPVGTVAAFVTLAIWPRAYEDGPIIAIAQFQGPKLPAPYDDCRPSDRLADTLSDVGQRYSHLTAFELPYVIRPDGRWAKQMARLHALLEGVDTVVYGEYSFLDNASGERNKPDRILISPMADQVPLPVPSLLRPLWAMLPHMRAPLLPVGPKTAPLQQWEFPDRIVRIEDLCSGSAQRFLGDGGRLGLAIVALQSFAAHEYVAAERARLEAEERPEGDDSEVLFATKSKDDNARCDSARPAASKCSGVLAFYLAALAQRMGRYDTAEREYAFAAAKLSRPAPYVDLAELRILRGENGAALRAFESAESADPTSLAAVASLARFERELGHSEEAARDLERARVLERTATEYGRLSLSRAIYGQNKAEGLRYRERIAQHALSTSADDAVEYGRWLIDASHRDGTQASSERDAARGIAAFRRALDKDPDNIAANYQLALALAEAASGGDEGKTEIRARYRRALTARAFTDDEFTNQGNAAKDLGEVDRARSRYAMALLVNPHFAYAYKNRGELYWRQQRFDLALRDLVVASKLQPSDCALAHEIAALSGDSDVRSVAKRSAWSRNMVFMGAADRDGTKLAAIRGSR